MTGSFGYKRGLLPLVLSTFGFTRLRYVSKACGWLLAGGDHKGMPVTDGRQYKRAEANNIPIKSFNQVLLENPNLNIVLEAYTDRITW